MSTLSSAKKSTMSPFLLKTDKTNTSTSSLLDDEIKKYIDAVKRLEYREGIDDAVSPVEKGLSYNICKPAFNKKIEKQSEIIDDRHTVSSLDVLNIKCFYYLTKERCEDTIKTRYEYQTSALDGHCKFDYDINAVQNYEAIKAKKVIITNRAKAVC